MFKALPKASDETFLRQALDLRQINLVEMNIVASE